MNDRVLAKNKTSVTPPVATPASSPLLRRQLTEEVSESVGSNSNISKELGGVQPKTIRRRLNWKNITVEAPNRSSASSTSPGGIQRLETSDVKEQEESKEEQNKELVQTKLTVGAPGDKYEQEADSMAAKVMTMPDEAIQQPIQRQTREETEAVQMQPLVNSITPLVQRESGKPPTTLEQLRSGLTDNARKAFDQQRELVPEHRFSQMETAYKNRDGTYDVDRANKFFEKKLISDAEYQEKIKQRNEGFLEKANDELARIENSCDETDGTNRPNSTLGDRTSESALRYESENGEPYKSAEGHYQKIATYIKTLQEAIQNLNNHRPFIRDPNKLSEIDAAINRAQERINKMQPALNEWNNRASNYPDKWNPNGISKVKPGWPSDPSPK